MFTPIAFFGKKGENFEEFILTIGENRLIRKWDLDGNQDTTGNWPIDVGSPVGKLTAIDYSFIEQRFMAVGHREGDTGYEVWDLEGNSILSRGSLASTDTRAGAMDENGNVYRADTASTNNNATARKWDLTNTEVWSRNIGLSRMFDTTAKNGIVSFGAFRRNNITTALIFDDNSAFNSFDCGGNVNGIDHTDTVLITAAGSTIRKYNLSGLTQTLDWTYDHGAGTLQCKLDDSGNVYFGGIRTSNISHRKLDSSGNLVWSRDHGDQGTFRGDSAIDIDSKGNIWFSFQRTSNISHRKYAPNGDLLVSIDQGVSGNGVKVIRKII